MDAVINHMCGAGGGEGTHNSCGNWFSANRKEFPTIPYTSWDFNDNKCRTGSGNIENYGDPNQVMNHISQWKSEASTSTDCLSLRIWGEKEFDLGVFFVLEVMFRYTIKKKNSIPMNVR